MVESAPALAGVFPVLQTPFDESGLIDEATLRHEIDWVLGCGVDGVVVAMVSEVLRLDHDERRFIGSVVCEATAGRCPAVLSVGAESTKVAVGLAQHAQAVGAAAVMAIPPLSLRLPGHELAAYFDAIVASIDLPLVVQDASSYVGSAIPVSVQAGLLERHGDRIYFKPEAQPLGPTLSELLAATGGAARAFDGSGGIALVDTFRRGIVGTMPSADVSWAIVRMWESLTSGDLEAAYHVSVPLSALIAMQTSLESYVAIEKHLLVRQKVFRSALCRGPGALRLDELTLAQVDRYFEFLQAACEIEVPSQ